MINKIKIIFWILTVCLLCLSSFYFSYENKPGMSVFFGDEGDGLFNIWIMEHNFQNVLNGNFNFFDGRIFQDAGGTDTLLWSDNLFVPTIFYGLCRVFTGPLTASFYTGLILTYISYFIYLLMFYIIYRIINDFHKKIPLCCCLFIPFFAFAANFSISGFEYYIHFQNLVYCFDILLFTSLLAFFYYQKKVFFSLAVFTEVVLIYSAPYFAVLGIFMVISWMIVQLRFDCREFLMIIKDNIYSIIIGGGLFSFMMYSYMKVDKEDYGYWVYRLSRLRIHELFITKEGVFKNIFEFFDFKDFPESPAYLGIGLVLGGLLLFFVALPKVLAFIQRNVKDRKLCCLFILLLVYVGGVSLFPENDVIAVLGLISLALLFLIVSWWIIDSCNRCALRNMTAMLIMAVFFCYTIALGPSRSFTETRFNPTYWGLYNLLIPGISSIRAIGRMCVPAMGFLLAIIFAVLLCLIVRFNSKRQLIVILIAAVCMSLQIVESMDLKAPVKYRYSSMMEPTSEEVEFFSMHPGLYLVLPVTPWYSNTRAMILFTRFNNCRLMNGYSAKSTDLWNKIMQTEVEDGRGSQSIIDLAAENKCDYVVLLKSRLPKYSYERYVEPLENVTVVYFNNRLVVLAVKENECVLSEINY